MENTSKTGYKYCSACKEVHPLYDENGKPTFSKSSKSGWQAWCKKSANARNVKTQRERRLKQKLEGYNQVGVSDAQINKQIAAVTEWKYLKRLCTAFNLPFKLSVDDIYNLYSEYKWQCPVCGERHLNMAFITTIQNGGLCDLENLVPLCNTHKLDKYHKPFSEWALSRFIEPTTFMLQHNKIVSGIKNS